MGRHTRYAGTLFTSLLLISATTADITIGTFDSPLTYVNGTGKSPTTLVPFSVSINSVPANDWDNVTYLNTLRSSTWNWGVNVSESSDVQDSTTSGTTQSIISLSWPEGDGPEANPDSPWSYCAIYIPEMGDTLLKHLDGDCANVAYGQCEKAVVMYLNSAKILTDTHFTCSGQQSIPVPDECKTVFGSDAPSTFTMYASNSMTSGSAFISRSDPSQSLAVGMKRPHEAVLFELAKKGTESFPAAIFINCFSSDTTVDPVLAKEVSSSSSATNSTTSTRTSSSSSSSEVAENYLTATSESTSTTPSATGTGSSHVSSTSASATTKAAKQSAMGGLGAASSISEGIASKIVALAGAVLIAAML